MSDYAAEPSAPPVEADPDHDTSIDEVVAETSRARDRDRRRGSPPGEANAPGSDGDAGAEGA
jgi:hypothetical protein